MAGELGVELARIEGSGPGGRVVKADVEAAAERGDASAAETAEAEAPTAAETAEAEAPTAAETAEAPAAPETPAAAAPEAGPATGAKGATSVTELTRLQRTVSRRMAESKATVPDFSLELDVDMTLCVELRERLKAQTDRAPSFNDMVVKAAALALRDHPRVNGAYRDGKFEALLARQRRRRGRRRRRAGRPDRLRRRPEVARRDLAPGAAARSSASATARSPRPSCRAARSRVSNLGMYGIERFTAIVNPPQAAILAVGALMKKPAVDDRGRVVARDLMTLTLICDHRILYGADGAAVPSADPRAARAAAVAGSLAS